MLEAWEKAEWSQREAQIQALQEEQLQAFQAEKVAQDGRVRQILCMRAQRKKPDISVNSHSKYLSRTVVCWCHTPALPGTSPTIGPLC